MSAKFALRSTLVLCVIMLLSTLVVSSAVSAQEITHDNPILGSKSGQTIQGGSPVPGGPGFISVSPFAFTPYDSLSIKQYYDTRLINGGDQEGYYIAPVNLPHKATVTKVVFFYADSAPKDMTLRLESLNLFDGSAQIVTQALSAGNSGFGYKESAINLPNIDNQLYSYFLVVVIPSGYANNLSLVNVRIDYDYPVFLPTVQK